MLETYDDSNVFARILLGEVPSDRVYEDDEFLAFRDIAPAAPTHILIVPRRPVLSTASLGAEDADWVGRMVVLAARLAREAGLDADGYRLVINSGEHAGQAVPHLHLHILGGGRLGPFA